VLNIFAIMMIIIGIGEFFNEGFIGDFLIDFLVILKVSPTCQPAMFEEKIICHGRSGPQSFPYWRMVSYILSKFLTIIYKL
jgi:hypothetical protein